MFGRGKCWQITGDLPNFTSQIDDVYYKETKQAEYHPSFTHQSF